MPVGIALRVRATATWRPFVAGALLCLALGAGLSETLTARPPSGISTVGSGGFRPGGLSLLPLASQGPVSETLGAADPSYRISAAGGGFESIGAARDLRAHFGRSGVLISSGKLRLGLSLGAVGQGASLRTVGDVPPRIMGDRVAYARAGLTEWYVNGPLGLEQGFTLTRALSADPARPLRLSLTLSGNAHAALAPDRQSVTLSRAAGESLRYGGLVASDARGRTLGSWLELDGGRLSLVVDARGARYPLRVDPLIQQGARLTGGHEIKGLDGAAFGWSVALSADGNTALIGGAFDNGKVGAAWVFTRSGETWTQQAKLTGGEESGVGEFGDSVALSADGNTALIGGISDNGKFGAAWVFTRSGETWTPQGAKLTGAGEVGEGDFGDSVALSADGNTALVGGVRDDGVLGAAWVFTRSGEAWSQQGSKLTGGEESGEGYFGRVALSADGNTALIGGERDNGFVGAAWVFTRSGETWSQQGPKLTGSGEIGEGEFGQSVALSADGDTALVGAVRDDGFVGAAWVFTRSGEAWSQQGPKLTGGEESGEGWFGYTAALSSDGNTALIGGLGDKFFSGAAWLFTRSGETWAEQGPKLTAAEESPGGQFGATVALSADASTALIGGPGDMKFSGAAWAFVNSTAPTVTKVSPPKGTAQGTTTVSITGTNFTEATAVSFGSTDAATFTVNSANSITAVSPAEAAGTIDVRVSGATGTSPLSSKDRFKFVPTVTSLSPNTGTIDGGTSVTVGGAGFALGPASTIVKFGSTRATSVDCISTTECIVTAPTHGVGTVDVKVTVSKASSTSAGPVDEFTYN